MSNPPKLLQRGLLLLTLSWLITACSLTPKAPEPPAPPTPAPPTVTPTPLPPTATPVPTPPPTGAALTPVEQGQKLAKQFGCAVCHSPEPNVAVVGPSWFGLYGKTETLADGTTRVVDDAFILEKVTNPDAFTVKGFPPEVMAKAMQKKPNEEQLLLIIKYMKTLK